MHGGAKMIFGVRAGFPAVALVAMRETSLSSKHRLKDIPFSIILFCSISFHLLLNIEDIFLKIHLS
jgi:hypothetical protein